MKTKYTWRIAIAATIIFLLGLATGCSKDECPKPDPRYVKRVRQPDAALPVPPVVLNPGRT